LQHVHEPSASVPVGSVLVDSDLTGDVLLSVI
jgi:hypothetical protein